MSSPKNSWLNYPVTSLTLAQNYLITIDSVAWSAKSRSQNQTPKPDRSFCPPETEVEHGIIPEQQCRVWCHSERHHIWDDDHRNPWRRCPQTAGWVEFSIQCLWASVILFSKCGIFRFFGFPLQLISQSPDSVFSVWETALAPTYSCEDSFIQYLTVGRNTSCWAPLRCAALIWT